MNQMALISKEAIRQLLGAVLRPLVRLSLKNLISFQEFVDLARDEFIAEARKFTHQNGETLNMSRISVLTGIHRREVKSGIEKTEVSIEKPAGAITRVLHLWRTRAEFLTSEGSPKPLECRGIDNDFRRLVRETGASVDAGAILKELLRLGYVVREGQTIFLKAEAHIFPGKENLPESHDYLEEELENLLRASIENIFTRAPDASPHVLLRTSFDNIPPERVHEIRVWFRKRAELLHEEVRTYLSLFDRDSGPSASPHRTERNKDTCTATFSSVSFVDRSS